MSKIGEFGLPATGAPADSVSVVIDATPLLLRSAGVKNYLYYWAKSLADSAGANRVSLFPFLDRPGDIGHQGSILGRVPTWCRLALIHAANTRTYPILDWFVTGADVFHASNLIERWPRKSRLTSTIYDMTCWLLPEVHSEANVKAARRTADLVFRKADRLIAISECTRGDAVRVLGLAPGKIDVIYPGIAPAFFMAERAAAGALARLYGLAKPYVLYVGTIEPRKNLAMLLDAWLGLSREIREQFDLVIAGSWGWGDPTIYNQLQAGLQGVRYLGYVPECDLPALTAAANAFVYVSLYEGFGLPLGQALAAGVPTIASNVSSLPEVAGDAALLVDPRSPAEIRAALERLLLSPSLASEMAERGRVRARAFTWGRECTKILGVFLPRAGLTATAK